VCGGVGGLGRAGGGRGREVRISDRCRSWAWVMLVYNELMQALNFAFVNLMCVNTVIVFDYENQTLTCSVLMIK